MKYIVSCLAVKEEIRYATNMGGTDIRRLARLISQVEARDPRALAQLKALPAARRGARVLGITGPPGAGKSTLVDQLIRRLRTQQHRVAVIAIDPSSPFSGGAVLGDRIRMQSHASDDGVFIRSVGSRGARGGLSSSTRAMVRLCDAHGFDWIIIETVGVGQSEYDIMEFADTTLVVLTPESGDTVQTLKAGLLEIADLFVVNKGDRDGVETMVQGLIAMIHLQAATAEEWSPPVVMTTVTQGTGIDDLMSAIERHVTFCAQHPTGHVRQRELRRRDFFALCAETVVAQLQLRCQQDAAVRQLVEHVADGTANPYTAVEQILQTMK